MKVYYSENGRALHYYQDCHQLDSTNPDALKTADEDELDRYVCSDCADRRSFIEL